MTVMLVFSCAPAGTGGRTVTAPDGTQWQTMTVERLPNLNVPRGNHRTVAYGDEIVVLGGHTDGFKPLETAEYYAGGTWHSVQMLYSHQNGFVAKLPDGRILLGGGSAEAFGIGQSWGVEVYDPTAHIFTAVGIMARKRALASALTLPDGSVIISGNWGVDDSWETWTAKDGFIPGGPVSPGWSEPYILPVSADDIIIFGSFGNREEELKGLVSHIGGKTQQEPLLEQYRPNSSYFSFQEDLQIGEYSYLVSAHEKESWAPAILKVTAGEFSLLEFEEPLPTVGPDGNPVFWNDLQVDRPARLVWLYGYSPATGSRGFARINYDATFDGGKASFSLFWAGTDEGYPGGKARLLPGGKLVLAGGFGWKKGEFPPVADYFKTYSAVYIFHTEPRQKAEVPLGAVLAVVLAVVLGLGGLAATLLLLRIHKTREAAEKPDDGSLSRNLMEQISMLIEEKELFRRKNLRITDIASELATNKTYVSILLNNLSGEKYTALITRYRVEYAQRLMREHPDMLMDDVADQSGFSSRTTFYRSFKAVTGKTPQAWKKSE